jgi:hypothetical protein
MTIELTAEQARAIGEQSNGKGLVLVDPRTKREYRLVTEEVFHRVRALLFDSSEWTANEMAILAGPVFGQLDDADYSEYLMK